MTDQQHVQDLVNRWHERRAWAEELLMTHLHLERISDIVMFRRGIELPIHNSEWIYMVHGIGVRVSRKDETGEIDFDFNVPEPDAWRLGNFARCQMEEGLLSQDIYQRIFSDRNRLAELLANAPTHSFSLRCDPDDRLRQQEKP